MIKHHSFFFDLLLLSLAFNIMNDHPGIRHFTGEFRYGFTIKHFQQLGLDEFILIVHWARVLF